MNSGSSPQDHWKIQVAWEESHLGNFRCIYPYLGFERYECYFHQNQSSLFQDTAASRAREECARIQREELEVFIQYFVFPSIELTPHWNCVCMYIYIFTFYIECDKAYKFSSLVYVRVKNCYAKYSNLYVFK